VLENASVLTVATGMERGLGFLANLLAARFAGAPVYGAYSLAMTTANNIAAYAGAGIGSTATRFSGDFSRDSAASRTVGRALALVSITSALIASALLFAGADQLARFLRNGPGLATLLRWASISAGVVILLECCRGYLVGQRRFRSIFILSAVAGGGMLALLPTVSGLGPTAMLCAQFSAAALAIVAVLVFRSQRRSRNEETLYSETVIGVARRIWSFGFVQLLSIVGLNAAGWWVASLVARSDGTMIQMGIFAVANQVRNIVAMVPGLLTQSSYGLLANDDAEPGRVLVFMTYVSGVVVTLLGGLGIIVLPWLLPAAWGRSYSAGVLAGSLALATAMVHMAGSPAAARLTIVSLSWTGVINALWSLIVFGGSFALLTVASPSAAALAMAIYLGAHLLSATLVLFGLKRFRASHAGLTEFFVIANLTALLLAGMAYGRTVVAPGSAQFAITCLELLIIALSLFAALKAGKQCGFSVAIFVDVVRRLLFRLRGIAVL
jgi:O-antigen/teichoic acid export membrane protein